MTPAKPYESPNYRGSHLADLAVIALTRLLDLYRILMSPILSAHSGSACRFDPTCSHYAKIALLQHGIWRGSYLAIGRLVRCHPWGSHGYDPVPPLEGDN
ncbi:MAG: membrane protein insertion efficiency factor YidD [Candidatus Binataceae bacterium]